eukprot:GILI01002986.1.p1 GENE.GILI01002986.1~~GILI01002986.1.p1  ORF type:complete len:588 (+),score=114.96 GILI01002986.1:144-1766(+)
MSSFAKRKAEALRKANFHLGTDSTSYESSAQSEFRDYSKSDILRKNREMDKVDMDEIRRTHFVLGQEDPTVVSTSKSAFIRPESDYHPNTVSREKIEELRKHNFLIGNAPLSYQTTFNDTIGLGLTGDKNKSLSSSSPSDHMNLKVELSKSHLTLGTDKVPYERSSQLSDVAALDHARKNRNAIPPERIKDLRSHHYSLGSEQTQYSSSSKSAFTNMKGQQSAPDLEFVKDLRSSHLTMGNDAPCFETSTKSQFTSFKDELIKRPSSGPDITSIKKDHNTPHFSLGHSREHRTFETTSAVSFPNYDDISQARVPVNSDFVSELKKTHFEFGQGTSHWHSLYKAEYASISPEAAVGAKGALNAATQADLRTHHFSLGVEGKHPMGRQSVMTESMADGLRAKSGDGTSAKLGDDSIVKNLKASHFALGTDPTPYYSSIRDEFVDPRQKGDVSLHRVSQDTKNELRRAHFSLGLGTPTDYTSTTKRHMVKFADMGKLNVAASPEKKKELTRAHFSLGTDSTSYQSSTKSEFYWKQPVPIDDYL